MLSHLSALPSLLKPSGWKQQQRIFPREQASSPYLLCILSCFLRTTQSPSHPFLTRVMPSRLVRGTSTNPLTLSTHLGEN